MPRQEQEQKILDFLKTNTFGVVSYLGEEGNPQSAVVAISEQDNLQLIFGSFSIERKNRRLKHDPRVSVVMGWDQSNMITIQYEGTAKKASPHERESVADKHTKGYQPYRQDPREEYFVITPTWIRYADYLQDPQEIWEITF